MRVRVYVGITRRGGARVRGALGRLLPAVAVPGAVRIVQGLRVLRLCSCGSPARGGGAALPGSSAGAGGNGRQDHGRRRDPGRVVAVRIIYFPITVDMY